MVPVVCYPRSGGDAVGRPDRKAKVVHATGSGGSTFHGSAPARRAPSATLLESWSAMGGGVGSTNAESTGGAMGGESGL